MTRSREATSREVYPWRVASNMLVACREEAKRRGLSLNAFITDVMIRYFEGEIPSLYEIKKKKKSKWYLQ